MCTEKEYKRMKNEILTMINNANYPSGHPFLDYPNTAESMPIKMIIIIYSYTKNINLVTEFVKKCNGKENGRYSFKKYKEGISELTWLYYLIIGVMKTNQIKVVNVYDEEHILLDNQSKFEYTFSIENPKCLIAFEVKSLSCDPFDKEKITIPPIDGQKIVKPFFPALKESDYLRNQSDTIVLNSSTHYNQIVSNINRINKKCNGKNISGSDLFFFGTMFITSSTSFEEFYSYFFNEEYGLYDMLKRSNIDALFLASLDAKNDLYLDNLYYNKYIQTIVPHPSKDILTICKALRLDNFIALGDDICGFAKEKGKEQYGHYKVLSRRGFLHIIPQEAPENEIENYLQFLESNTM